MKSHARGNDDAAAVLAALVIGLGLLSYGWWKLGDAGRLQWLNTVSRAGGYGPVPTGMLPQLEWLAVNRLGDLQGMAALLTLAALAGLVEGNARREAVVLSGFGLRRLQAGRAFGLAWLACLVLCLVAPLPLPYVATAVLLTALLGVAGFLLAWGVRRAH